MPDHHHETKVLDYGDVVLRRSDLDLLLPQQWLNDQVRPIASKRTIKIIPAHALSHKHTHRLLHFDYPSPPCSSLISTFSI